ncbi:MAG: flagellar motor protein MotB [Gammaproteobacteria bacterium]|jgi:flagellar motor protein MotB
MKRYTDPTKRKRARGEPWQVIYTDLMTIIMVFFVILWSTNQGKDIGISETIGDISSRTISLPGDVLFPPGEHDLSDEGKNVFNQIFYDETGQVLNFQSSGLTKRLLVINGHTDSDGEKDRNLELGFRRAFAAYEEVRKYSEELADHVVICTYADNSPQLEVPKFEGEISTAQRQTLKLTKSKNRRITIEDKIVNKFEAE